MKTFKISLLNQYSQRSKTQKYLAIILGIVYLIAGISNILKNDFSIFGIFWLISAIGMFASGYFYSKFASSYFLLINDENIISKDSIFNKLNIPWENIKSIKFNPISILFFTESSGEKRIHLQNLSYENVLLVKSKLKDFASGKNIKMDI